MRENSWDLNAWLAKVPNTVWALLSITLLGFLLRVWGLDFGLPNDSRPDEWNNENVVLLNMLSPLMLHGDFRLNPAVFNYGSLYYSVALIANWITLTWLQFQGQWFDWQQVLMIYENDVSVFFLILRWISVIAGTSTIPLIWLLAKKLPSTPPPLAGGGGGEGPREATVLPWIAASLAACCYLWVRNAHFGTPDALFCLTIVFSLWAILRYNAAAPEQQPRAFVWACVSIGLAMGVKYPGAMLMIPLAVALFRVSYSPARIDWEGWLMQCLKALAYVAVTFLLTSPWVLLDYPHFLSWISYESAYFTFTLPGIPVGWQFYPTFALFYGVGWGVVAFFLLGVAAAWQHSRQNSPARWTHWILWSALLAFYLSLGPNLRVMTRYAMPLVPVILLYAAYGIVILWQACLQRRELRSPVLQYGLLFALTLCPLWQPLSTSIQLDQILAQPDTRTIARAWILQNVKPNQPVAVGPRLGQIRLPNNYGQLMLETGPNNLGYPRQVKTEPVSPRTRLISTYMDISGMRQSGIRYVVIYGREMLFSNPPWEQELYAKKAKAVFAVHPFKSVQPESTGIAEPFDAMQLPFTGLDEIARGGPALIIYDIGATP